MDKTKQWYCGVEPSTYCVSYWIWSFFLSQWVSRTKNTADSVGWATSWSRLSLLFGVFAHVHSYWYLVVDGLFIQAAMVWFTL